MRLNPCKRNEISNVVSVLTGAAEKLLNTELPSGYKYKNRMLRYRKILLDAILKDK